MGWVSGAYLTLNPIFQMLRPILADRLDPDRDPVVRRRRRVADLPDLHGLGVPDDRADRHGVHTIEPRYLRAAANFRRLAPDPVPPGGDPRRCCRRSSSAMRIGLGVAWLVVVAAEMIALRSGLGYLIIDSRNAGNRYDLVIAGTDPSSASSAAARRPDAPARGLRIVRWRFAHR
jgi:NitT/TauT family transport system permease protein